MTICSNIAIWVQDFVQKKKEIRTLLKTANKIYLSHFFKKNPYQCTPICVSNDGYYFPLHKETIGFFEVKLKLFIKKEKNMAIF